MSKIIGAVEIGTSKAKALIGEVAENGVLNVVGMASRPNEGMRKGEIVDFRKAAAAVHSALEDAEKMSGTTVDEVYLAQTGSHLKGNMLRGSASVASSDNRVDVTDHNEPRKRQSVENQMMDEPMSIMSALLFYWMVVSYRILLACLDRRSIWAIGLSMGMTMQSNKHSM